MKLRDIAVAIAVPLVVAAALSLPIFDRMRGLSVDLLFLLRNTLAPSQVGAPHPAVAVIAIDEATYHADIEPFRGAPRVFWTRALAQVLDAVVAGGVTAVGFDLVLPTSVKDFAKDSGFEKPFLAALARARKADRIVLGAVTLGEHPILPHKTYRLVARGENIRSLNVILDPDGVIRFVPLQFRSAGDGALVPSMSLEMAQRWLGQAARRDPSDGALRLGDYRVPALPDPELTLMREGAPLALRNDLLVDLYRGPASFQTYSFLDLYRCLGQAQAAAYFARHFKGKAVMLGLTTDVEDRRLTAVRYGQSGTLESPVEPCTGGPTRREAAPRTLIPGVYLHAAAISNMIAGDALRPLSVERQSLVTALFAVAVGLSVMKGGSGFAAASFLVTALAWVASALVAFVAGLVLPLVTPVVASGVTVAALMGYRFAVSDRTERHIRQAFGRLLAPALVERMVQSRQMPTQGGELREITVWVSDLQNYTTISEILSPPALVDFLNEVYSVMSDTVEEHEGFVAQFVGDAVVAGFNVPLDDPEHARHGIEAAMACCRRVEELAARMDLPEGFELRIRVGVSTGDLLVGYIGSKRRLSYSIVGDDINLASRLEGVNKVFGSTILVNEITRDLCGPSIAFREIDIVRVKGRDTPVRVFEPLGPSDALDEATGEMAARYAEGLAAYRARRFDGAAAIFESQAERDPVSRSFAARARDYAATPPPEDWDGVLNLLSK